MTIMEVGRLGTITCGPLGGSRVRSEIKNVARWARRENNYLDCG